MFRGLILSFISISSTVLICGCRKDRFYVCPGEIITNATDLAYADLAPTEKIVIIGDRSLTKGDLEKEKVSYLNMLKRVNPSAYEETLKDSCRMALGGLVAKFLYVNAFDLESKRLGISPKEEYLAIGWQSVSNSCLMLKKSYAEFSRNYPGGEQALIAVIERDARIKTFFERQFTNSLDVTDEEVERLHRGLVEGNNEASATNRVYLAQMKDFRKRLLTLDVVFTGEEDLDQKLIPDGFRVEFFQDTPIQGFDDENKVLEVFNSTAKGEWSLVTEMEDTIDIFNYTNVIPKSLRAPALYSGIRIYREKDHGYLLPDKKSLREDIKKRKNIAIVEPFVESLQKKFGVTFPYGFVWAKPPSLKNKSDSPNRGGHIK